MSNSKNNSKNKSIHPEIKQVNFTCATCGSTFPILSTLSVDQVGIDVCSNCHPVYVGTTGQTKIRGRAEKLAHRFVDETVETKKQTVSTHKTNKQDKKSKSFSDL